jgi:hypothetical protein
MVTRLILAAFALGAAGSSQAEARSAPLYDPVLLNIGIVCKWNQRCINRQQRAMRSALTYVKKNRIAWKVEICNRNSGRNGTRKDWIGFNNCVRNPKIRPRPRR